MSIFEKLFSKMKNLDSEEDFVTSELKKEKNTNFKNNNSNSQNPFFKEENTEDDNNNINMENISELLKPVIESLGNINSDKNVYDIKFNDNDFKDVRTKYTSTYIIKDGKRVYESSSGDSEVAEAVNELFDKVFNKK